MPSRQGKARRAKPSPFALNLVEAEGLVDLADLLALLQLRAQKVNDEMEYAEPTD